MAVVFIYNNTNNPNNPYNPNNPNDAFQSSEQRDLWASSWHSDEVIWVIGIY